MYMKFVEITQRAVLKIEGNGTQFVFKRVACGERETQWDLAMFFLVGYDVNEN